MNDTEKIREFIERVKGEHGNVQCGKCHTWKTPCDALRAVLALEETVVALKNPSGTDNGYTWRAKEEALARAAQKIGEKQ